MVLESFIRRAMEKYLSDLLEGVDHQAVSLQLMKGEVTLDEVSIRPEFLKSLSLPFPFPLAFHRAVVGHLQLGVNWSHMMSQPLLIKMDRIHLWAEGKAYDSLIGVDSAYVKHTLARAIQDKIDRLSREEEIRLMIAEGDERGEAGGGTKKPSVIIARLIAMVTTTIQLEINDVHICISIPGIDEHPGLHMGLAIEQIKFETTDADWKIVPLHLITGPTYKCISIKNCCLYINPDPRADELAKDKQNNNEEATKEELKEMPVLPPESLPSPEMATAAQVAQSMHYSHSAKDEMSTAKYQFVIKPFSLGMNLTFNKNLIPTVEVHAIIDWNALQITLTRPQLLTILHLKEAVMTRTEQVTKWIERQPAHPPITDAQQTRYMHLYKSTLNALWLPELTPEELKEKELMERELPYEELSLMRHAAVLELKKELGTKKNVSERSEAIAQRTHWWDKLFRSEDSVKASIEEAAEPEHQLTQHQKKSILQRVRGEGTVPEAEVEEEDSFSMDDLVAMLTFHLSAEINIGEIGLELWNERSEKTEFKNTQPNTISSRGGGAGVTSQHTDSGENIIAVAAREQRERDDKAQATEGVKPRVPRAYGSEGQSQSLAKHYAGESLMECHLRPYLRLQINHVKVTAELEKEGDAKIDAEIETIQCFDLSQCQAKDPWTAAHHSNDELVEFGYIGPIIPVSAHTKQLSHSVERDVRPGPSSQARTLAPAGVPAGLVLRLRRSAELLNNDQRNARAQQKMQGESADASKKEQSVTDILFGSDPDDDKATQKQQEADKEQSGSKVLREQHRPVEGNFGQTTSSISPALMFSSSVSVRSVADLLVNNVRVSFTDSLLEIPDFIRSPPAPYSEGKKKKMEKGEGLQIIDNTQPSSDKEEQRTGGEHKPSSQAIGAMQDPQQREQHQQELQSNSHVPVKSQLTENAEAEAEKNKTKNLKDRHEKEKRAIDKSVRVLPGNERDEQSSLPPNDSSASTANTVPTLPSSSSSSSSSHAASGDDIVSGKPSNSLSFLSWFSPLLVRVHVPQPYLSVIPDTAARQLTRLTVSLNANARVLLDGEKDSIHGRAEITQVRAWLARTVAVQSISLASFYPPSSDEHYLIKPFNINAAFERFPSPLQQLLSSANEEERRETAHIAQEFRKEVGETHDHHHDSTDVNLQDDDILNVFNAQEGLYHMDAEVDIDAIHIKLAAKLWYLLQPLLRRIKQRQEDTTVD